MLVAPDGTGPGLLIPTEPVRARPPARKRRASVAQRQSATFTPWKSEGQHLPGALGGDIAHLGGGNRMERRVVVDHLAGSSILLVHPGGPESTQRGGMVTSRVSYARRSPVSTERCDWGRADSPGRSYEPSASGQHPRPRPSDPLAHRKRQPASSLRPRKTRTNEAGEGAVCAWVRTLLRLTQITGRS